MNEEFTREEKKAFFCGLFAILIFMAVFFAMALQRQDFKHVDDNFYHLKATFSRTDGLLVGDLVRMSGVDVGRVVDAHLDENFHAVLTLEIKEGLTKIQLESRLNELAEQFNNLVDKINPFSQLVTSFLPLINCNL